MLIRQTSEHIVEEPRQNMVGLNGYWLRGRAVSLGDPPQLFRVVVLDPLRRFFIPCTEQSYHGT